VEHSFVHNSRSVELTFSLYKSRNHYDTAILTTVSKGFTDLACTELKGFPGITSFIDKVWVFLRLLLS